MTETIPPKELAEILRITVRAVNKRAQKEGWEFETLNKRGDRRFIISGLPGDVRTAVLITRQKEACDLVPSSDNSPAPIYNKDMLCQRQIDTALSKADLLKLYLATLKKAPWGKKEQTREKFMMAYNSGIAYPKLFEALGEMSFKTIEGWKQTVRNKGDALYLSDRRGYWKRGKRVITEVQQKILLQCALHPNKPLVSEAIRMARAVMDTKEILNGHSDATYRRWLSDWKSENHHVWTFSRKGAKAWNDECAFYIERDYSLINVGDILVADGHTLNFEIINPWTGKPKRMTLILWYDMKSSFPLGWEIMPTENTHAIASALRRAILRLGKYPQVAYLDNGKAFSARFFQGADLEQAGFSGLFERLGIKTIYAWPYHAQSKTVERFFGTFAELERWSPTYVGTSIDKKPPRMMRSEKLHRKAWDKLTQGNCLTLEQAHRAIAVWFDDYVQRPQRGHLEGVAPIEIFMEEKGPGIDPLELRYLMMSQEIRHIKRNGIRFLGANYYDRALYGRRHPVVIRYDLQNKDSILVFEKDGTFLCEALQTEKAHPAAGILGTDEDRERLKLLIEHKRSQENEASIIAREFIEQEVIPEHRRRLEADGLLPDPASPKGYAGQAEQKVKQLTAVDEEKILAEVKELERMNAGNADDFWSGLQELSEADRYEKLLEAEIRGMLIPKEWQAFMTYYEQTQEYSRHGEYWESCRMKYACMWQAEAGESTADGGQGQGLKA